MRQKQTERKDLLVTPPTRTFRIVPFILAIPLCLIFLTPLESARAKSMTGPMDSMGTATDSSVSPKQSAPQKPGSIPGSGFVIEGLSGEDTSLSGSYGTTAGETVPYNFGTAPLWGVRAGKMFFPDLLAYLTVQQSFFSQNTHTVIGLGGNYYLPSLPKTSLTPYLNATFGASYNTYTGVNAQAGYAWMLGAGALTPISPVLGIFLEADLSYETAPTGINTSIGSPPGTISRVSDTWSVPVMIGIRYAF
jgi:hypothetical protein